MKSFRLLLLAAAAFVASVAHAAIADIVPPKKRAETVALAQRLLQSKEATLLPAAGIKDPFTAKDPDPAPSVEGGPGIAEGPPPLPPPPPLAPDRELIEAIAPLITPTGTAIIGGQSLLLFGSKRLKVGDTLPIIYKDKPYELTITAIEGTNFTLRLRAEEITRPIRSTTKPSKP
jgi:hypothetical protein